MAKKRKQKRLDLPRPRAGGEWTEARYWNFIRTLLRAGTRKYPPIVRLALDRVKRPMEGKGRGNWEYQCCDCKDWYRRKGVQVDHIEPCGQIKSYDDLPGFVERMFCEPDSLCVRCKDCHQVKTQAEREGND